MSIFVILYAIVTIGVVLFTSLYLLGLTVKYFKIEELSCWQYFKILLYTFLLSFIPSIVLAGVINVITNSRWITLLVGLLISSLFFRYVFNKYRKVKFWKPIQIYLVSQMFTFIIIFILSFLTRSFLIQTFLIDGSSMEPNFHNNEYILVNKLSYHFTEPKRDDVDTLIPPDDLTKDYIKRIIGVPGDTVEIKEGHVFVNGKTIKEPYLTKDLPTFMNGDSNQTYKIILKSDQFFVLGDNRSDSRDSRNIGMIPRENIIGKVI